MYSKASKQLIKRWEKGRAVRPFNIIYCLRRKFRSAKIVNMNDASEGFESLQKLFRQHMWKKCRWRNLGCRSHMKSQSESRTEHWFPSPLLSTQWALMCLCLFPSEKEFKIWCFVLLSGLQDLFIFNFPGLSCQEAAKMIYFFKVYSWSLM